MHSVRRAVLRSAASASTSVTRTAATSTTPIARSIAAQAQAVRRPTVVNSLAIAARYFSQTTRVANTEEDPSSTVAATESQSTSAATTSPTRPGDEGETPYAVFIRNVVFDASEAHLQEAFEHYGAVSKCVIARDARGMSRGYGFVWFEAEDAMTKALGEANGSFWHGRRLIVMPRAPRQPRETRTGGGSGGNNAGGIRSNAPPREPSNSLYIGNLPYETTDADLNVIFRELSGLKAVRVAVDRSTGWPRGFAHADFDTIENATAGYEFLQNKEVGTRTLRIDYAAPSKNNTTTSSSPRGQAQDGTPAESSIRQ